MCLISLIGLIILISAAPSINWDRNWVKIIIIIEIIVNQINCDPYMCEGIKGDLLFFWCIANLSTVWQQLFRPEFCIATNPIEPHHFVSPVPTKRFVINKTFLKNYFLCQKSTSVDMAVSVWLGVMQQKITRWHWLQFQSYQCMNGLTG